MRERQREREKRSDMLQSVPVDLFRPYINLIKAITKEMKKYIILHK